MKDVEQDADESIWAWSRGCTGQLHTEGVHNWHSTEGILNRSNPAEFEGRIICFTYKKWEPQTKIGRKVWNE